MALDIAYYVIHKHANMLNFSSVCCHLRSIVRSLYIIGSSQEDYFQMPILTFYVRTFHGSTIVIIKHHELV